MSIAVSALVGPSRAHRIVLAAGALVQFGVALALAPWRPVTYPGTPLLALLPTLALTVLWVGAAHRPKAHRIDISGTGELRVTVQQGLCAAPAARLLPGSVVWPMLLVLRYQEPGARPCVLLVWRDAVDKADWRALAVALAVIGRRGRADDNNRAQGDERTRK